MLIQFTVGNYRSFKEKQTLSMLATKVGGQEECVREVGKYKLLTSAAIYGANASGKSNLIQAMKFALKLILNPSFVFGDYSVIDVAPFRLAEQTYDKPSYFEFIFIENKTIYRYGFEVSASKITKEWLYHTPTSRESLLFERQDNTITLRSRLSGEKKLTEKTRFNHLFLSVLADFNNQLADKLMNSFNNMLVILGVDDSEFFQKAKQSLENEKERVIVKNFLKEYDTDINDIKAGYSGWFTLVKEKGTAGMISDEEIRATKKPRTMHYMYDKEGNKTDAAEFFLKDESDGTQKLFAMALPVLSTLANGGLLVIDEMDARLHPIITESIVRLFQQRRANPNDAQLIFATHDTNLLDADLLRRDQVWFTEKNRVEATNLYSLVEYKPRKQENYEKNYIQGRYGAIPFVGRIERLVEPNDEE